MKFSKHSDEQMCGKQMIGEKFAKYDKCGGVACMRTAGHLGECIAIAGDAGRADGVHWCCRSDINAEHQSWCFKKSP